MAKKQGAQAQEKRAGAKSQQKKGAQTARSGGGGPVKFAKDVRGELRKVNWPNREQLRQSTAIVILVVLFLMAYVAAWDFVFRNVAGFIFG
ncbi:preprotein translocase, SecE subunit [Rubrobacter radiotolerans]|uniref:Protein translocase subunit SecE n=1 Tax=Rubrobacter radiotolerans TaxID=42256 RepID=A0A023X592_RUBRA|nr:preprotein translocase subunit SecE [Rubrobacter radiotolerans]AHY47239.1 preprotein translocase, SecE subunit [Rubrobacter radiotolerans]MDX5894642.1 preprotein translocase subunit SecE [Rubrobacter radiotolerans]SMC06457.1 preprotein translocase subunit SecE [Rubrobacter radiotolerans DSM 5868]